MLVSLTDGATVYGLRRPLDEALILHSAPPPGESRPITDSRLGDVTSYASPEDLDQLEQKLPSLGPARLNDWVQHQQQLQLYTKQKRLSQLSQMQQQKQRYMPMVGQKVAQKRWWGGRPQRGQIDRRASQNKHLDCLKSCIKQGTLHPIQCHTLC
ncbi:hypothetical protein Hamer_G025043 [Homarus americanus]|uniref:Uncharacterized protein n=1 Tax=Homarus americanus TaxID=6706 RepID=A0A8J5TI49_HOMAM|nr:hypothetical protein Hamer_G025043 [Homarus americanus]